MTEMIEVRHCPHPWKYAEFIQGVRKATAWNTSHLSRTRPTIRDQPAPKIPVVFLLTEDVGHEIRLTAASFTL